MHLEDISLFLKRPQCRVLAIRQGDSHQVDIGFLLHRALGVGLLYYGAHYLSYQLLDPTQPLCFPHSSYRPNMMFLNDSGVTFNNPLLAAGV